MTKSNVAPLRATDATHRELSWFSERVERGRGGPFVEITTVTPTIAARLLEMNDGNRPINERRVREIASDIEKGFWTLNGETIIVSKDGLLNDGQHRLEAVVRCGRPIQTAIMYGVEREARMTVDMGTSRSASNFLDMSGVSYSAYAASAARSMLFYERGLYASSGGRHNQYQPTKQEIRDYYERNKKAIDCAVRDLVNEKFIKSAGPAAFLAAHIILHRANPVEAGVFFQRACDGANLKSTDAILWLRSRFMSDWKKRRPTHEKIELILRHWNRWRTGAKVTRAISCEGSFPKVTP